MQQSPPQTAGSRPQADNLIGATILIVEDAVAVRNAVRRLLEHQGYRVLGAPNGGDALVALAESP
jgi:CheY-like chemotaxis protein